MVAVQAEECDVCGGVHLVRVATDFAEGERVKLSATAKCHNIYLNPKAEDQGTVVGVGKVMIKVHPDRYKAARWYSPSFWTEGT